jgi:hypothetical protein
MRSQWRLRVGFAPTSAFVDGALLVFARTSRKPTQRPAILNPFLIFLIFL